MSADDVRRANAQHAHYEAIHDAYTAHYYDAPSMAYRQEFIYSPLFKGLDLNGSSIADLACGSGHNSQALRQYFPEARTTGYDISPSACEDYERLTGAAAHRIDLTLPTSPSETHDAAIVIGGLHHCVRDLPVTLRNIAGMIRPDGHFLMMEPSDDFLLSALRRYWYRKDRWFEAETEAALRHDRIAAMAAPWFTVEKVLWTGGPAFYLILNSLITRVPLSAKPALARVLFPVERLYNAVPGRAQFAVFLAHWRRTDAPA